MPVRILEPAETDDEPLRIGRVRVIEPAQPVAAPKKRKTSQGLGFAEGVMKPLDNAARALEGGVDFVTGSKTPGRFSHMLGQPSAQEASAERRNIFAEAEKTRKPGAVGKVAGEIVGTIPAVMATRNPFIGGAAQGALLTDANDVGGVATDAALGGVLGHVGGKVVDFAADAIKPVISPAVRRLQDAGVKLTPGMVRGGKAMVREDKAMSRPIIGDAIASGRRATQETFNTASVNEALKPLGVKVPTPIKAGHDAVGWAHDAVSQEYDRVIPNLTVTLNPQAFVGKIAPTAAGLKQAEREQLQAIMSRHLGSGQLSGQELKNAQGEIRRLSRSYSNSASASDRELGRALGEVDDELTGEMVRQNPKFAPELQRVNKAFRGLAIIEDAASRADDGIINTGQLKQAVRRGDTSRRKAASARGDAFMQDFSGAAREVIPARTPDSGTAGRLNAGNIFATAKGGLEAGGYYADDLYQRSRLLPRPKGAAGAAKTVRRLRGPAAASAVAASREWDE
jgi:hypothetical protein